MKIIHALVNRKSWAAEKLASASKASVRLLINTHSIGMISNLPYLLKEFAASTCDPDDHTILTANVARMIKINRDVGDLLVTLGGK